MTGNRVAGRWVSFVARYPPLFGDGARSGGDDLDFGPKTYDFRIFLEPEKRFAMPSARCAA